MGTAALLRVRRRRQCVGLLLTAALPSGAACIGTVRTEDAKPQHAILGHEMW